MDDPQKSSRLSAYNNSLHNTHASNMNGSAISAPFPFIVDAPVPAVKPATPSLDYKQGAKQFKRHVIKARFIRFFIVMGVLLLVVTIAAGTVGYVLNKKYSGRALPYTYIGPISVGGLSQAEINATLTAYTDNLTVTFTEGGLVREASVAEFGPTFDIEAASSSAITGFNPFAYLAKRTMKVPVTVNERYVDGYLAAYVANKQVKPKDAYVQPSDDGFTIISELQGFRTSTAYVVEQMNTQLAELKNPIISLTAQTESPDVTQSDLQTKLESVTSTINLEVGIQVWSRTVKASEAEKTKWFEFKKIDGGEVEAVLSSVRIREYVFGLADKYTFEPRDDALITNDDGTQRIEPGKWGNKVTNADEIAQVIYEALLAHRNITKSFTMESVAYKKIDPSTIVVADSSPPEPQQVEEPLSQDITEEPTSLLVE